MSRYVCCKNYKTWFGNFAQPASQEQGRGQEILQSAYTNSHSNTRFTLVPCLRSSRKVGLYLLRVVEGLPGSPFPRRWLGVICMNWTAAYAMYPRNVALPRVVCALNEAGFGKEDICMVLSPAHPDAASVFQSEGKDTASARMIDWFSKFGAVFIPTVGFFIRSQAFLGALSTEQNTPKLSRGSGTLLGLGFPQEEAQRLGRELSDFGALVCVSCTETSRDGAIKLLRDMGAREAASLAEAKLTAAAAAA